MATWGVLGHRAHSNKAATMLQLLVTITVFAYTIHGAATSRIEAILGSYTPCSADSIAPLLRSGLAPDTDFWRQAEPARGRKLHVVDVLKEYQHWVERTMPSLPVFRLVLVYNNTWLHLDLVGNPHAMYTEGLCHKPACRRRGRRTAAAVRAVAGGAHGGGAAAAFAAALDSGVVTLRGASSLEDTVAHSSLPGRCIEEKCNNHLKLQAQVMGELMRQNTVQLPNALFLLHVSDNKARFCSPDTNCSVPVFSEIKGWSADDAADRDTDILIPQMVWTPEVSTYPWDQKKDQVLFRGHAYCGVNEGSERDDDQFKGVCSRVELAYLAQENPDLGLEIGLVNTFSPKGKKYSKQGYTKPIQGKGKLAWEEHVHYKYLVHLEGYTASSRLGQLMSMNSVVLRAMESNFTEHYYRLLKPCNIDALLAAGDDDGAAAATDCHFFPFFVNHKHDIVELHQKLQQLDREQPGRLEAVAASSQAFAARYLTLGAKVRYWQEALTAYRTLFEDMDGEIEQLVAVLRKRGFNFHAHVL